MSATDLSSLVRRADVCAVAIADCFRGDGEILANPIGTTPMVGGRLARATFEPDLTMTDGEAALIANDQATVAWDDRAFETVATAFMISIGGGTDQIQRNIVGERVLGLPGEPRTDKDVSFRDLPADGSAR